MAIEALWMSCITRIYLVTCSLVVNVTTVNCCGVIIMVHGYTSTHGKNT